MKREGERERERERERPKFVAQWCMSKIDLERQELLRILALARHPTEISAQCAWHIFKTLYPARVLHLLRAMPHEHAIPLWSLLLT